MSNRFMVGLGLFGVACGGEPDGKSGAVDADGDGFTTDTDCDDANNTIFPGAPESCNGLDDDCDEVVDEDPTTGPTFHADGDGDGYGDPAVAQIACDAPSGFVSDDSDCDDADPAIHPGAPEEDCTDPVDYNCDGSVGWADADADGSPACEDCDDADAAVHPGAVEVCNDGIDDDCDGVGDESGALGESLFFSDSDGDGHGDPADSVLACAEPSGYVTDATDCDDTSAAAHPGGSEICDGVDNDCDGRIDDASAVDAAQWYPDGDGDGHGAAAPSITACEAPTNFVSSSDDCDDAEPAASPSEVEVCDEIDNNCDGSVDEGLTSTLYADLDGDGYGTSTLTTEACSGTSGYVATAGDCDEGDASIHPGASEVCDGADNDCDGATDDADASLDVSTTSEWYADGDGDGYGDAAVVADACDAPSGYVSDDSDCDDGDGAISPLAVEIWYDGVDQDCDAASDYDADGDGSDSVDHGGIDEDDTDPTCVVDCFYGLTQGAAAASCEAILVDDPAAADGVYWIDPNDDGDTTDAFEVECDMTNGGWAQCFELVNTTGEDLNDNSWLDDCVDYTGASWTGTEVRVTLETSSGIVYDAAGDHAGVTWTYDQVTSTTGPGTQYYSPYHGSMVSLDNGDKLMISGRNAQNNGCGGSMGNGYGIVVYPTSPNYHSNPKIFVFPYRHQVGSTNARSFSSWSQSNEISYSGSSFNSCSSTPAFIGTFAMWVR